MKHDFSLSTLRCKVCQTSAIGIDRDIPCAGVLAPELPTIEATVKGWWPFLVAQSPVDEPKPFNFDYVPLARMRAGVKKVMG